MCDDLNISCQILNKNDLIDDNKEIILVNYYGALAIFLNIPKVFL